MFDIDKWQEIFSTIRKNKLRTFLTGFSVAWGIFMLVVLLGSGVGLENGVRREFAGDATSIIRILGGRTSLAYDGIQAGRDIRLTNDDYDRVKYLVPRADNFSARRRVSFENSKISYKKEYGTFDILGVHPDMRVIGQIRIEEGRFINEVDVKEIRKVVVISKIIAGELFRYGEQPIGQYVKIGSIPFQVAGIYENPDKYDNRIAYIPLSTAQKVFAGSNIIHNIMYTTGDMNEPENEASIQMIREDFAKRFRFDPNDKRALWIRDNLREYRRFQSLFFFVNLFVGFVGLMTIAAGVVGVSNIMVIVVKERTKEIGIRKALGATPRSIISLILLESVFITTLAGYFGLVAGVGLLELLSPLFENSDTYFLNPHADFNIAMGATLVLIISGTIAGLVPALRAARIKPIEALRDE